MLAICIYLFFNISFVSNRDLSSHVLVALMLVVAFAWVGRSNNLYITLVICNSITFFNHTFEDVRCNIVIVVRLLKFCNLLCHSIERGKLVLDCLFLESFFFFQFLNFSLCLSSLCTNL